MYEIHRAPSGKCLPYVCDTPVRWARNIIHNGDGRLPCPDDWHDDRLCDFRMRVRGFHTPLENGLVLSTQWGEGNYCVNRRWYGIGPDPDVFLEACPDAELAAWWDRLDGDLLEWPCGDSVLGHFNAGCWWELVDLLGRLPTGSALVDHPALVALIDA